MTTFEKELQNGVFEGNTADQVANFSSQLSELTSEGLFVVRSSLIKQNVKDSGITQESHTSILGKLAKITVHKDAVSMNFQTADQLAANSDDNNFYNFFTVDYKSPEFSVRQLSIHSLFSSTHAQ